MSAADLRIEKTDREWKVLITSGPSAGLTVTRCRRKRDASAWIEQHGDQPWGHVYRDVSSALVGTEDAIQTPTGPPGLVTIPLGQLWWERRQREAAEREARELRRKLIDVQIDLQHCRREVSNT